MPVNLESRKVDALARAWRAAKPFPHVVLDELLSEDDLARLRQSFAWEPHTWQQDEIHTFLASGPVVTQPGLVAFREALGRPSNLAAVARIGGRPVGRVEVRAYTYLAGHYLLPHGDHREGLGRQLAFAFYVGGVTPLRGGELELFACRTRRGEIVETRPVRRITPRPNRLVLFEVSDLSLHQVREVTEGARMSLAGWFYP